MSISIPIRLNEAELVSAKAALYEYARRISPGIRRERALALARRFSAAAVLIDSDQRRVP